MPSFIDADLTNQPFDMPVTLETVSPTPSDFLRIDVDLIDQHGKLERAFFVKFNKITFSFGLQNTIQNSFTKRLNHTAIVHFFQNNCIWKDPSLLTFLNDDDAPTLDNHPLRPQSF